MNEAMCKILEYMLDNDFPQNDMIIVSLIFLRIEEMEESQRIEEAWNSYPQSKWLN